MQEMCYRSLDLNFKAKLMLESGNQKIQYGHQAAILEVTYLRINRLLPIHTSNVLLKFGLDIQSRTEVKSPETQKSNMAGRQPFWKWHCWKSMGSLPWTQLMWQWSLDLIFKAKLRLESGNRKIQDGRQAAILKVTSLKINRLLPMATNMHMEFQIGILKQTWVTLRKHRRTDRGRRTRWFQYTPPPTSLGWGIKMFESCNLFFRYRLSGIEIRALNNTVKPVYNDHLIGHFPVFWSSSR